MHRPSLSNLSATLLLAGCMAAGLAAQNDGLDWLQFVGGPGDDIVGWPNGIDIAPNGDIWLAGASSLSAAGDVQVTHLTAAGVRVSNWTLGGSAFDRANVVRLDPAGTHVHVAGFTSSADFPVTPGAVQPVNGGGTDMFWTVLDATTGAIVYSTFLGGSATEVVTDLAFDPLGDVWLYGATGSADFPTRAGAFQSALRGTLDLVLARIDRAQPGNAGLRYATYFGGDGAEPFNNNSDLSVETSGVVTFFADTSSPNLPVTGNAWQPTFRGGMCDTFVTRLDTRQTGAAQLAYSTYAGGSGFDNGNGMWVEGDLVTIAGWSDSPDLPTRNAPQPLKSSYNDAYVLQLDISQPPASQLRFGTYLGGGRGDGANDVAVDAAGLITITGVTGGVFPTTPGAWLPNLAPLPAGSYAHSFVARLDPFGGRLLYSTYVGTDNPFGLTGATALRPDGLGGVLVVGRTNAPNLPVTQGPPLAGTHDAWLAKLSLLPRGAARCGDSSWASGLAPSFVGVTAMPRSGDSAFAIKTSGAPGTGRAGCAAPVGAVLVSLAPDCLGLPIFGATLHLAHPILLSAPIAPGRGDIALPLTGIPPGARASFQFAYAYSACSLLQASNALEIVVQQ